MLRFVYRVLQRIFVLEGVAVLVGETLGIASPSERTQEVLTISQEQMRRFVTEGQAPYCDALVDRLDNRQLWCFGIVEDARLVSFAWFFLGSAEAEMNQGYCPATATEIRLTDDAAFVFNAYTARWCRGRGLMSALLRSAAATLREHAGANQLVGTTELVNRAALSAFGNAGIKKRAAYWRFGVGPWSAGWYPRPQLPVLGYGD